MWRVLFWRNLLILILCQSYSWWEEGRREREGMGELVRGDDNSRGWSEVRKSPMAVAATIVIRIPKRIQDRSAFTCHCPFPFPSLVPSLSVHRPSRAARSNGITIGSASATPPASQGAPFNSIFSSVRGTLFISRLLVPVSSLLSFLSPPISRALLSSRSTSSLLLSFTPARGCRLSFLLFFKESPLSNCRPTFD